MRFAFFAFLALAARVLPAQEDQSLFEKLNLDKLRLSALGGSVGAMKPSQMHTTRAYSLHSDYGEIVPSLRLVFSATYWESRYTDKAVRRFSDQFRSNLDDPSNDDVLHEARIKVSDIAVTADLRYDFWSTTNMRAYLGGGGGAHVLNGEGKYISQTFIETSLDNIAAGVLAVVGGEVVAAQRLAIGIQGRYDLLSGVSYGSIRFTGSYHFSDPGVKR